MKLQDEFYDEKNYWMGRSSLDRRIWWAGCGRTNQERKGPITFKNKHWSDESGNIKSFPHAVMNDYGNLSLIDEIP